MPKRAPELTAAAVRGLTRPGVHAVGGVAGLMLAVKPTGARSWILRATIGSKRRDMGLGPFPDVTLGQAREKAREARALIDQGIDPVAEREAARARLVASQQALTFEQAARQYLRQKEAEFRNKKHRAQWHATLEQHAFPVLGKMRVAEIELPDVLRVLEPIWLEKTETAKRLRGRIESVLSWATVSGHRSGENPARWRGNLDVVLQKPSKVAKVQHLRALPWQQVGEFFAGLREREGMGARALEFAILTAARSGEVRGAVWSELDLEAGVWIIPAHKMKAEREHRVPLSKPARTLLEALPRIEGADLVFPSSRSTPLSDMSLTAVLRRMEVEATVHGFRSTFRDWCAERTNYPREVAEMALAHKIPDGVEAAYRRGDLLAKRKRLMDEWAKWCGTAPTSGQVRSIRAENS